METSKDNMTEYLEKFQMYQRMLQGVAHVHVESTVIDFKVSSHSLNIFPLDEKCDFIRTKDGDATVKIFSVAAYYGKEENDKVMKEAHKYVKSLKPVAA